MRTTITILALHIQQAYITIEGTHGAIKIQMGLLIKYPEGMPASPLNSWNVIQIVNEDVNLNNHG